MPIRTLRTRIAAGLVAAACTAGLTTAVTAAPAQAQNFTTGVYSAAMKRTIPVKILRAANGSNNAPTLYLLDGLRAPNDNSGWLINTDVVSFFANKNVNVVLPFGGAGTFYTDWQRPDPKLGWPKWESFLTRELPAVMKAKYGSDGVRNAIAGLSMSGTSALNLATRHPNLYRGVASFSGYPLTSQPGFAQGIGVAVSQIGGDVNNMWGVWPGGSWLANDPGLNAARLRGKRVYISSGSGGSNIDPTKEPTKFAQLVPLEVAASIASQQYVGVLRINGINPVVHITAKGVHFWVDWQNRLHEAWFSTLGPSIGA
ncbi:alpha/beta hydrolase family protein [Williamsia sp. CHRR-6]|uniref:alpha/beta hydrolase n=1 Tax=Williamsia sp. CHRR-6 TaxID=2835871 RepID=UPI001BD9BBC3|nr:alpha/beta hydrolase family protein [Williamsia sp. CHRR-6]MBT0567271.1 esterase family protein [Williamsia sp. CHRR-6]